MLELSGESKEQAAADAKSVLAMETALAKAAMDIVVRRDPKNVNHKMTAEQVQALTPSFKWSKYFGAMQVPVAKQYLVTSPDFFKRDGKADRIGAARTLAWISKVFDSALVGVFAVGAVRARRILISMGGRSPARKRFSRGGGVARRMRTSIWEMPLVRRTWRATSLPPARNACSSW